MALATDVRLPIDHDPVFPDRCVRCGGEPNVHYRASARAVGWWTVVFFRGGKRHEVDVPACAPCKRAMTRQRWLRLVSLIAIAAVGVWLASRVLGGTSGYKRWLAGAIALGVALPWVAWSMFWPAPFDMTPFTESIDYEFADAEYAEDFARLNS